MVTKTKTEYTIHGDELMVCILYYCATLHHQTVFELREGMASKILHKCKEDQKFIALYDEYSFDDDWCGDIEESLSTLVFHKHLRTEEFRPHRYEIATPLTSRFTAYLEPFLNPLQKQLLQELTQLFLIGVAATPKT